MITIDLGTIEYYDSVNNQFAYDEGGVVRFEYTLKVVYDWEAKWRKPFLKGGLTDEEAIDFYMMMALDPIEKQFITNDVIILLSEYIKDSQTATTFTTGEDSQNGNNNFNKNKIYTSEELYAHMITAQIPLEFENRNLNRLLAMLRIIANLNNPPKKMSKDDILRQNAELNRKRREQYKTKG